MVLHISTHRCLDEGEVSHTRAGSRCVQFGNSLKIYTVLSLIGEPFEYPAWQHEQITDKDETCPHSTTYHTRCTAHGCVTVYMMHSMSLVKEIYNFFHEFRPLRPNIFHDLCLMLYGTVVADLQK